MVKVKFKGLHVGYRLVKICWEKKIFLGHLEPSKEAGSPLLFSKSFFPDFSYENFLKVFLGSFGGEKTIYEKENFMGQVF